MDTPPFTAVTDTNIVARHTDATLYIVRQGYTPKSYLRKLRENNELIGLKNIAIIFNGVKKAAYSKYGYDYRYGYAQKNGVMKKETKKVVS